MSETTSESGQAHLAEEPSMEDILDSIRKIIADDDQTMDIAPPQALGQNTDQDSMEEPKFAIEPSAVNPTSSSSSPVTETVSSPALGYDENSVFNRLHDENQSDATEAQDETVDLDIEALLSGAATPPETFETLSAENFLDEDELTTLSDIEIPDPDPEDVSAEAAPTDILDLSVVVSEAHINTLQGDEAQTVLSEENDDSLFDQLEGLLANVSQDDSGLETADLETGEPTPNSNSHGSPQVEDNEALLEEVTEETEGMSTADITPNSQEPKFQEPKSQEVESPAFLSDEADMDMVKSLMADLTEPEEEAETEAETLPEPETASTSGAEEDIPALDDILQEVMDEISDSDTDVSDSDRLLFEKDNEGVEFDDSDILDDIINMSLDAELAEEDIEMEDALQIPEPQDNIQATVNEETEIAGETPVTAQSLISSLMEIAGEAEQDAEEAEATLEAASAPIQDPQSSENTDTTAAEISGADMDTTSAPQPPLKETADMPKAAVNQDRILDDVSEKAATSAFASLNNIVEEKAVKAERGDRIGDLVMEALRPMLKEWLDEHLNDIVERAVTKEVQRISSGK